MEPRILEISGAKVHVGDTGYSYGGSLMGNVWEWHILLPDGTEHFAENLHAPLLGASEKEMLSTLLSFLGACAESWDENPERRGENADLFPEAVARWAAANDDEISCAQMDLEGEVVA